MTFVQKLKLHMYMYVYGPQVSLVIFRELNSSHLIILKPVTIDDCTLFASFVSRANDKKLPQNLKMRSINIIKGKGKNIASGSVFVFEESTTAFQN